MAVTILNNLNWRSVLFFFKELRRHLTRLESLMHSVASFMSDAHLPLISIDFNWRWEFSKAGRDETLTTNWQTGFSELLLQLKVLWICLSASSFGSLPGSYYMLIWELGAAKYCGSYSVSQTHTRKKKIIGSMTEATSETTVLLSRGQWLNLSEGATFSVERKSSQNYSNGIFKSFLAFLFF